MAISPQQLTIYLYSAHRAVIFAIAQLSCLALLLPLSLHSRVVSMEWIQQLKDCVEELSNFIYLVLAAVELFIGSACSDLYL